MEFGIASLPMGHRSDSKYRESDTSFLMCGPVRPCSCQPNRSTGALSVSVSCSREVSETLHWNDRGALLASIKSCGKRKDLQVARRLHTDIVQEKLFTKDICINNALVSLYVKCGDLKEARKVFDEFPMRNVISWNALISGYAQQGLSNEALSCFKQMCDDGLIPTAVTYVCVLKACANAGHLKMGQKIHNTIIRQRLLENNVILGTALVDMYAKCNMLGKAQEVFDELSIQDVVSWNALINGYSQQGFANEALNCFRKMKTAGLTPDAVTYAGILKACGSIRLLELGEEIYDEVCKQGLLRNSTILATAFVDMYAKCNKLEKAREVFDSIQVHDVTSWSALISGYVQHGLNNEALNCFIKMQEEGFTPDAVTYICVLKTCGNLGCLQVGDRIYSEVKRQGLLKNDVVLGTALVDMYAKCGVLEKACNMFDMLPVQNVASWTALMTAYAQSGQAEKVLEIFGKLLSEGVVPDLVTVLVVLSACNHAGLVKEGQAIFDAMKTTYCMGPTVEHYSCMVDLFSRAGHFDKAIQIIEKMPASDRQQLWLSLLGACCKWINVEIGRWAFIQVAQLDERCDAAYVYMGNIFVAAGMHEEANEIEAFRVKITGKVREYYW